LGIKGCLCASELYAVSSAPDTDSSAKLVAEHIRSTTLPAISAALGCIPRSTPGIYLVRVSIASARVRPRTAARVCRRQGWLCLLILVPLILAVGCATVTRQTVPKEFISEATVPDMPDVQAWGDGYGAVLQRSLVESIRQARAINPQDVVDATGAVSVLALSGGGANGAFGAGLLDGRTQR
jgi:hypothetical protein